MSKRKNQSKNALADKLSGDGADLNTPGLTGRNDGTKTEKSDGPDDLLSNNGEDAAAAAKPKKPSLGVDVLHESYVAAD